MMIKRCLVAASLLAASTAGHAQGLDISLSDKTANLVYLTDSGSLGYGGADMGFGLFFNENDDYLGTGNLLVTSHPTSGRNLQLGVGAKAYLGEHDASDETVGGIGIGGLARYVIPAQMPMGIALEGYVAPQVTSFGDTKGLTELMARFELEIMPSTRGYIGYRLLEPEFDDAGEVEFDDEVHLGIRITY